MRNLLLAISLMCCYSAMADHIEKKTEPNEATKFEFYQVVIEPTENDLRLLETHEIMDKKTLFMMEKLKSYTYTREDVVPGESMQRIVSHKPEIYKAVTNIQKGLQKAIKKNETSSAEATQEMNQVLQVALSAFYDEQSDNFEKALRENKQDFRRQIELFRSVTLK